MRLLDSEDAEPLPIDGMEVEEFRDAATVRLFILEWRRCVHRRLLSHPMRDSLQRPDATRAAFLGGTAARVFGP